MTKTKIGFIGTGWRAHGYMRVIRELKDTMEVAGVLAHSAKSEETLNREFPGKVHTNLESFSNEGYDFVMLLVPRQFVLYYMEELLKNHIPVLCETPPGDGVEELKKCWELKQKYNGKIQVAEQYFLQPYHKAVIDLIKDKRLGEISHMDISMIHDYHGISIMRKYMGIGFENCKIIGREYSFPVNYHCGREGLHPNTEIVISDNQKRADFIFENGKVGFFDFSGEQYFNYYRTRHIRVDGDKGEVVDDQAAWMGSDGIPVQGRIMRDELGQYSNLEGYGLRGLSLNGEYIYKNPFAGQDIRLSDDEIAMAGILEGMRYYLDTGKDVYSLEEALQDAYLYLMMDQSIQKREEVETQTQVWAK
ncbi:MAG: Gfo/Idh/MocA family protein [Oliverpabstia sp.]